MKKTKVSFKFLLCLMTFFPVGILHSRTSNIQEEPGQVIGEKFELINPEVYFNEKARIRLAFSLINLKASKHVFFDLYSGTQEKIMTREIGSFGAGRYAKDLSFYLPASLLRTSDLQKIQLYAKVRIEDGGASSFLGPQTLTIEPKANPWYPRMTGTLSMISNTYGPGDIIAGTAVIKLSKITQPLDLIVDFYAIDVQAEEQEEMENRSGELFSNFYAGLGPDVLIRSQAVYRLKNATNGTYTLNLQKDIPFRIPDVKGPLKFRVHALLVDAAEYDEAKSKNEIFFKSENSIEFPHPAPIVNIIPQPKTIALIKQDLETPPPVPVGNPFYFNIKYKVSGLPRKTDESIAIEEKAELREDVQAGGSGPTQPPISKTRFQEVRGVSGGEIELLRRWKLVVAKPGPYVLKYSITSNGYVSDIENKEFRFTAKDKQATETAPSGQPQAGDVWTLYDTTLSCGQTDAYASKTELTLTANEEFQGNKFTHTISWTAPPKILRKGQEVALTITAPKRDGSFLLAGYDLDLSKYVKSWAGHPSGTTTKPKDQYSDNGPTTLNVNFTFETTADEFEIRMKAQKWIEYPQLLVTWKYKRQKLADSGQVITPQGESGIPSLEPEPTRNFTAWLETDTIELAAGEISKSYGVYVKDWDPQGDPVEVIFNTTDGFGTLADCPNVQVMPATTSNSPFNIITDGQGTGRFAELWSVRSTAGFGTYQVPIVVRQKNSGQVRLLENIRIIGKTARPGIGTGTPPGSGTGTPPGSGAAGTCREFTGEWIGKSGDGQFTETWSIQLNEGRWDARGYFQKGSRLAGMWTGEKIRCESGRLQIHQLLGKSPDPNWAAATNLDMKVEEDTIIANWSNEKGSGVVTLFRRILAQGKEFPENLPCGQFAGEWIGISGDGQFTENWSLQYRNSQWEARGNFLKRGKTFGSWTGREVRCEEGRLRMRQVLVQIPDPGWAPATNLDIGIDGDTLLVRWNNEKGSGLVTLFRRSIKVSR